MINNITISGAIGQNANIRQLQNNKLGCIFNICHNENRQENGRWVQRPIWFKVECFAQNNQWANSLVKGANVVVSGSIKDDSYTNKHGAPVKGIKIFANNVEFTHKVVDNNNNQKANNQGQNISCNNNNFNAPF